MSRPARELELTDLADALLSRLRLEDREASFRPIAARVVIRTGVDIRSPRPDQVGDPAVLAAALSALHDMGFARELLFPVPRPRRGSTP
jgi:hypothetical protein